MTQAHNRKNTIKARIPVNGAVSGKRIANDIKNTKNTNDKKLLVSFHKAVTNVLIPIHIYMVQE